MLADATSTVLAGKRPGAFGDDLGVTTIVGPMAGGLFTLQGALQWHTEVKDGSAGNDAG